MKALVIFALGCLVGLILGDQLASQKHAAAPVAATAMESPIPTTPAGVAGGGETMVLMVERRHGNMMVARVCEKRAPYIQLSPRGASGGSVGESLAMAEASIRGTKWVPGSQRVAIVSHPAPQNLISGEMVCVSGITGAGVEIFDGLIVPSVTVVEELPLEHPEAKMIKKLDEEDARAESKYRKGDIRSSRLPDRE